MYIKRSYLNDKLIYRKVKIKDFIYKPQQNTVTTKIYTNQSCYDNDKPKRATATNIPDNSSFRIKRSSDKETVYSGVVKNQIIDFSDFKSETEEEYYITCEGVTSYNFYVGNNLLSKISIPLALKFMEQSRQDTFSTEDKTGYGWRDSHQFSFELNSLVLMYMANPSLYENMNRDVYKIGECEYEELRVQNEPNIIWLIKFAVTRYWDWGYNQGVKLHGMIKGQLAYFLYLYPHISQYVTRAFYEKIRDFTIEQWGIDTCNKSWYSVTGEINNLFEIQKVIGTEKGSCPPGYAIIPNLLMYEVCKRDGLPYQSFWDSAYNNCEWLVNNVDLDLASNTKGQRMSERITLEALSYFYKMYQTKAPNGLLNKIKRCIDVFILRSDNMWDFRKISSPNDTTVDAINDVWTVTMNECGNVAGFPSVAYSCIMVNDNTNKNDRLNKIALAHFDNCFGRNPLGCHYNNQAVVEVKGADKGCPSRLTGLGDLGWVIGCLDGSPKENAYPFDPNVDVGYAEGWVAFNTAWNDSLAYLNNYYTDLQIVNNNNGTATIILKAPLNMTDNIDKGKVFVNDTELEVVEENYNSDTFKVIYTIPSGVNKIVAKYGIGLFEKSSELNI